MLLLIRRPKIVREMRINKNRDWTEMAKEMTDIGDELVLGGNKMRMSRVAVKRNLFENAQTGS